MNTSVTVAAVLLGCVALLETLTHARWAAGWAARQITTKLPRGVGWTARTGAATLSGAAVYTVFNDQWQPAVAAGILAWLSVLAVDTDLGSYKIPREACHAVAVGGLALLITTGPAGAAWLNLALSLLLCVLGPLLVAAFVTRGGLGLGDIRLWWAWATCLGWWLGFVPLAWALLAGFLFAGVVRLLAHQFDWGRVTSERAEWAYTPASEDGATRPHRKPRRHLPFAPSLTAGLVVATAYALTVGVNACSAVQGTTLSC